MTTRTLLLSLHIASVAAWLGADVVNYVITPRIERDSPAGALAWARAELWMHERYYAVVAVLVALTGVGLVLDGDWPWSSWFIWVGVGAIVGGATLGGGGLGSLAKRHHSQLEAGDEASARATRKRMLPVQLLVTLLPVLALVAMVHKWHVG
jgi:hypothetical protein